MYNKKILNLTVKRGGAMNTLNQLITIATVSQEFRQMLLTNPSQALVLGYNGREIELTAQNKELILKHNSNTLEELAEYILIKTQVQASTPSKKVIITPDNYPLMTTQISEKLKQHHFNVESAKSDSLINAPPKETDLVLFCPITTFSLVVCTKLIALYPQKVALLADFENHKIPNYLHKRAHFISLNDPISKIVLSIQQACEKDKMFYSQLAAMQLLSQYINDKETEHELSKRENQVACLLDSPNKKIAKTLGISISTVRTHIQKINEKFGFDVRSTLYLR